MTYSGSGIFGVVIMNLVHRKFGHKSLLLDSSYADSRDYYLEDSMVSITIEDLQQQGVYENIQICRSEHTQNRDTR